MFIQTNDRLVNLKNVGNIHVLENHNRIVFNMNYYIQIEKRGILKQISDYCYWDLISSNQLKEALDSINENEYFKENFISHGSTKVNINEISSIKFSDKKNRIIINLSHAITFTDYNGNESITSDFVYFNFDDYSEYKAHEQNLKLILKGN